MNKIVVDKESKIELSNNIIDLEINNNELELVINGKVLINEISFKNEENLKLVIRMNKNSTLIYNRFISHNIMNNDVKIIQEDNSDITFNYSIVANDKCNLNVDCDLLGNKNNSVIKVRAVAKEKGKCNIKSTASVKPLINNNELLESIKVITLNDEEHVIIPNLLVSSNEVVVNHAATISSIDPSYLFYLNSKGIDNKDAKELITKGFLLSNMDNLEGIKDKIDEII